MRRSSVGMSGSMPFSKASKVGRAWPSFANTDHSSAMSSRVVVSSSDRLTYWPQDSFRLAPLATALAMTALAWASSAAFTVSVSKADSLVSVWPSCRRPCASTAV
ncbi:hypothetical protein Y695_03702 [Hydrogenophaga sp. T4]|nr:hypothetical protein Y695_03702 [Hydrogenophaga sp. T4]